MMDEFSESKETKFVAINNGKAMYLYSVEEAYSYSQQGWIILQWRPVQLEKKIEVIY